MNVKAFALSAGIVWGAATFLLTFVDAIKGTGEHLKYLVALYPGYHVTYVGSVVGLVYGFISGALAGAAFGWLYNCFAPKSKA